MNYNSNFNFKSERQRKAVMAILSQRHGGGLKLQGQENAVRILSNRDNTQNLATQKRRKILIEKIKRPHVVLSEAEIQILKNNLNSGNDKTVEFGKELNNLLWNHPNGMMITNEQTSKGIEYLNRPNIRKQMGAREEEILDNFKEFRLVAFHDDYNGFRHYYSPYWRVIANDGSTFEYHQDSKGISIDG